MTTPAIPDPGARVYILANDSLIPAVIVSADPHVAIVDLFMDGDRVRLAAPLSLVITGRIDTEWIDRDESEPRS